MQTRSFCVAGNPLIPAFSPKGGKETEARVAHEGAGRSGSLSPSGRRSPGNHGWTRMNPVRPSRNHSGVRGLVRAFCRRLVAVECGTVSKSPGPLNAALLWRQVAKAAKAVTSHRTPNSSPGEGLRRRESAILRRGAFEPAPRLETPGRPTKTESRGQACQRVPSVCPEGTGENSPAFERWVRWPNAARPGGTVENRASNRPSFQPSLRDSNRADLDPGVETPGYFHDVPSGQRHPCPEP